MGETLARRTLSKRILLINPGHDREEGHGIHQTYTRRVHRDPPPVALLSIAGYLREKGFDPEILDTHVMPDYKKEILRRLDQNDYLWVGFTTIIGKFLANARELTSLIRAHKPDTCIVWGGVMASLGAESLLRTYDIDFIVRFSGEDTSVELSRALLGETSLKDVAGILYRREDGGIQVNRPRGTSPDLDCYCKPAWDLLGKDANRRQVPYYFLIMTSRGCPYDCSFCYHTAEENVLASERKIKWRQRSAESVIAELDFLNQLTGSVVFTIGDDNFCASPRRAIQVLEYARQKGYYFEEIVTHMGHLKPELISAMTGVVQTVIYAIESASERLHGILSKRLALDQVPEVNARLFEAGCTTSHSFMVALPTEEDEDLAANVSIMKKLKEINPFARGSAYIFLPLPETPIASWIERKYALTLPNDPHSWEKVDMWVHALDLENALAFRPWLTKEEFLFKFHYAQVFNDLFHVDAVKPSAQTTEILRSDPRLARIFGDTDAIRRPSQAYRPYVLDRVLTGDPIDLTHDLSRKVLSCAS